MRNKRITTTLFTTLAFFAYLVYGYIQHPAPVRNVSPYPAATPTHVATNSALVRVARVVDGDTVVIETGEKVRYIGINTPETVDPRKPVECYGKESSAKNKELVEGKEVRLEKDVSDKDIYGRLLRYVWVGDTMINELLVRQGFAEVATYPPDVRYQDRFLQAEQHARQESIGLWGSVCEKKQR